MPAVGNALYRMVLVALLAGVRKREAKELSEPHGSCLLAGPGSNPSADCTACWPVVLPADCMYCRQGDLVPDKTLEVYWARAGFPSAKHGGHHIA